MHGHKTYDAKQIAALLRLISSERKLAQKCQSAMDDVLVNRQFEVEVNEALLLLWDDAARKIHDMGTIRAATAKTLEGISCKCPDFPVKPLGVTRASHRTSWKIAVVLIPLLLVGSIVVNRRKTETAGYPAADTSSSAVPLSSSAAPPESGMRRIEATHADQIVRLPDGSTVHLLAGGALNYREDFSDHRKVTLKGNAFFSVVNQDGNPFEVKYNDLTVFVLGTEFYLHESEKATEITLHSGSVEVVSGTERIVLSPSQQLVMDMELGDFSVFDLTEAQLEKMIRGGLRFDGTPLDEAIKKTGEFFGIHIDAAGMDIGEPVRLQFGLNDELEDVLYVLQSVSGNRFDYEITGPNVIIRSR